MTTETKAPMVEFANRLLAGIYGPPQEQVEEERIKDAWADGPMGMENWPDNEEVR